MFACQCGSVLIAGRGTYIGSAVQPGSPLADRVATGTLWSNVAPVFNLPAASWSLSVQQQTAGLCIHHTACMHTPSTFASPSSEAAINVASKNCFSYEDSSNVALSGQHSCLSTSALVLALELHDYAVSLNAAAGADRDESSIQLCTL